MSRGECYLEIEKGGLFSKTDGNNDGPADQEGEYYYQYCLETFGGASYLSLVPDDT